MTASNRPNYWRMQLHPDHSELASFYTVQSTAAGFIGLDCSYDVGDLFRTTRESLPEKQRDYWEFAHSMLKGDLVLIICHHFPFALVTVDGEYNYIRKPVPEIGVWFRHFRRIKNVRYYSDYVTNAASWKQLRMTDTISPLRKLDSESRRLIESWK